MLSGIEIFKFFVSDHLNILGKLLDSLLSLISTHAFRLPPAKFFAWDMCRVVKRTEQDEERSSTLFAFKVKIFQLLRNFLTAKPIRLLS